MSDSLSKRAATLLCVFLGKFPGNLKKNVTLVRHGLRIPAPHLYSAQIWASEAVLEGYRNSDKGLQLDWDLGEIVVVAKQI